MPRTRSILRAVSRDEHRATGRPNPARWQTAPPAKTALRGRSERREHGWRGNVSAQLHGPHPMRRHFGGIAGLLGNAVPTSGQVRIDAKRNQRAAFWADLAAY